MIACWLVAFPVAPLVARRVAWADERLARSMLGPGRREELAQRAAAVDGTLSIDGPPGGPTAVTAELPCQS